jgi:glycogen debranching enzyme
MGTHMTPASTPSRIRLRPRHDVIHVSRGRSVLATDLEGTISSDSPRQGLFVYQTRMLSDYRWKMEGKQPQLSVQSPVEQYSWLGYYYDAPPNCKETPAGECNPLQQTVELKVSRVIGEGMHEDVELWNHTQIATSVSLKLEVDGDFVSRKEVKKERKQKGKLEKKWSKSRDGEYLWRFHYTNEHDYDHQGNSGTARLERAITLHLRSDSAPKHAGKTITFQVTLEPHGVWRACLKWVPEVDGNLLPVEGKCNALRGSDSEYNRKAEAFLREATALQTGVNELTTTAQRVLNRSRLDMISLRMFDLDEGENNWKLAAGIPTYLALFGRDMLASAWQANILSNDMLRGALSLNAKLQAHDHNDWRGAQPGRMLHESHTDPLSVLNFTPQALYYGTISVPLLFPICVSELWHWTGDKDAVRPYIKPALDALAWADKYSRDEKSGFYKYQKISEQGIKNQGWKDSSDAIVYPDGSQVEDPLGTCEMQGFAYIAKWQMAETLWWLGETDMARRFYEESEDLKNRFNDRFWMDDIGYVGMAIDKDNEIVKTVASDPGHCVLSGILRDEYVPRVVNRMMRPDMFSGWGIRTLSSDHPAYNPFAYHRGTVWPVENGSFVLAMARYGLHGEMWQLARSLFEAASLFDYDRLPEVFGGHSRDDVHPFPCLYEHADSPQAWSASVPFLVMQALLGIYPYAPMNVLFLDPWLPEWLPEVRVENLKVGNAHVTLRFSRNKSGRTDFSVEELRGELHVLQQPSPWSFTAGWGERVKDAVMSLLPSK